MVFSNIIAVMNQPIQIKVFTIKSYNTLSIKKIVRAIKNYQIFIEFSLYRLRSIHHPLSFYLPIGLEFE